MIVGSDLAADTQSLDKAVAFYKAHYEVVDLVECTKCKTVLALELSGPTGEPLGLAANEVGRSIIPVSGALLSSRIRLDEAPTGERMRGYQCACGNDTRISQAEKDEGVPVGPKQTSLDPFSKQLIAQRLRDRKDKPKFKKSGNTKVFETFKVRTA